MYIEGKRGNRLGLVKGDRVELLTTTKVPSEEIGGMMRKKGGSQGEDDEREHGESAENEVSVKSFHLQWQ
jgi:hypothetical protein